MIDKNELISPGFLLGSSKTQSGGEPLIYGDAEGDSVRRY